MSLKRILIDSIALVFMSSTYITTFTRELLIYWIPFFIFCHISIVCEVVKSVKKIWFFFVSLETISVNKNGPNSITRKNFEFKFHKSRFSTIGRNRCLILTYIPVLSLVTYLPYLHEISIMEITFHDWITFNYDYLRVNLKDVVRKCPSSSLQM